MVDFLGEFGQVDAAVADGTFDPQGANARYSWSGPLQSALPAISPAPGLPGSQGSTIASGGSALGGGGLTAPAGGTTGVLPGPASTSTPAAGSSSASPAATSGLAAGSIADYFARAVLVILGMIFVAVGLHMFAPSVVPDVRRVAR